MNGQQLLKNVKIVTLVGLIFSMNLTAHAFSLHEFVTENPLFRFILDKKLPWKNSSATDKDFSQWDKGFNKTNTPQELRKFHSGLINFDVVLKNDQHLIYRSAALGSLGLKYLNYHLKRHQLPFPKTIIYMNNAGYQDLIPLFGDFAIEEYEQQQKYGYRFYHSFDYDYRTYVDGMNPYEPGQDIDKSRLILGPKAKRLFGQIKDDQADGGVDAFVRVLKVVLDKDNHPILFHCLGGRHRTGMIALAIRYLQGGEWIHGPKKWVTYLGKKLHLNPAQYEYYLFNKDLLRTENFAFIEKFSQDPEFQILKEQYAGELNSSSHFDLHSYYH